MDLLQRTGWRVRLDLAADVLPCCIQLFCPALLADPQLLLGQQAKLALPAASAAAHQEWATALRQLCAIIREKSRRLKAHEQATNTARLPTPEPEDEAERPAKRRRAAGSA
ncbi:hypothetical protein COHA_007728 [Chlorella ohadii]|uniref:Uncharacterized protein n=1 Tax=Chlorella ohadii TaxID=2649997 RepID=A0AAD5DI85_9CHLO|nr:hypothetical protein COHA_007728 [Chlorella ohadii]